MNDKPVSNLLLSFIKSRSTVFLFQKYRNKSETDNINWQFVSRFDHYPDDELICSICLCQPLLPRMDKCGHIFCLSCLINFSKHQNATYVLCPVCKNYNINVAESKRVTIATNSIIKPHQQVNLKLLVKGKKSLYPDHFYHLAPPLSKAPLSTDTNVTFSNVAIDLDTDVVKRIQCDIEMVKEKEEFIGQLSGEDIVADTLQFLYREQSDFEVHWSADDTEPVRESEKCLDGFNVLFELPRQLDRFTMFYQCSRGRFVFLEPAMNRNMLRRVKTSRKLKLDIWAKVTTVRTLKATEEFVKESGLSHVPPGAAMTFLGISRRTIRFYGPPSAAFEDLQANRETIVNDLKQLERERQESAARRAHLAALGIDFTPMVDQSLVRSVAVLPEPPEDSFPPSFNMCLLGLDCVDPDDDYPHSQSCVYFDRRPPASPPPPAGGVVVTEAQHWLIEDPAEIAAPVKGWIEEEPRGDPPAARILLLQVEEPAEAVVEQEAPRETTALPAPSSRLQERVAAARRHDAACARNYPPDAPSSLPASMRPAPFTVTVVAAGKKPSQRETKNQRKQRSV